MVRAFHVIDISFFSTGYHRQLAFGQLAAAIALAVQTQRAGLETKLLSESISLVAIGVSISPINLSQNVFDALLDMVVD